MKKDILIYFDLLISLRTTQDVEDLATEIDTFIQKKSLDLINVDIARNIRQIFTKNKLDINDPDVVSDFFHTLKGLLNRFKVIKLVLAFVPTYKTIENIHDFIKEILGIGYILDIEILDELLGGAIIIYNGKYFDFSLKKRIEDTFIQKNKEILQLYK